MELSSVLIVVGIIGLIVLMIPKERIRCQRCGYRGPKRDFIAGRCPGCGSLEL